MLLPSGAEGKSKKALALRRKKKEVRELKGSSSTTPGRASEEKLPSRFSLSRASQLLYRRLC